MGFASLYPTYNITLDKALVEIPSIVQLVEEYTSVHKFSIINCSCHYADKLIRSMC